jgi:predicted metal-dependent enzyme (double-stranded beta helix superfamily)
MSDAEHRQVVRDVAMELISISDAAGPDPTGSFDEMRSTLERVLAIPHLERLGVPRKGNHFSDSLWLYYDTRMSIVCGPLPKLFSVPVHNHGTWEVLALYRGAVKYTSYQRMDDGETDYYAKLEVEKDTILRGGDITMVPPPPHDVHGFTGLAEDTFAVSLIGNPMAPDRDYFYPDQEFYVTRRPHDWEEYTG